MARAALSGRLRIGDEWNAISLIARTQSNPLKAVAELVENSLDAKARTVEIVRARRSGRLVLTIADDGQGVSHGADGRPDFRRVATHICDSMKRYLDDADRRGVHGEFGIGLLGFWSVGERLRMVSRGADGAWEMHMKRGEPRFRVYPAQGELAFSGTQVDVIDLLPSTRSLLTGEKLDRYLATELRDRIRQAGATVRIVDRVARKAFTVRPREFEGEPIPEIRRLAVPGLGEAGIELHYRVPPEGEGAALGVYVCRDGTRVLQDVRFLGEGLDRPPWNLNRLEGIVDFPRLTVAPATREGVVPDQACAALVGALAGIEAPLVEFIRKRESAEAEKASEQLLREVQRALVSALRDIPEGDYQLFDIGTARNAGSPASDSEAGTAGPDRMPGPLERAVIVPARVLIGPNETRTVAVRALDAEGVHIVNGLEHAWELSPDGGSETAVRIEPQGHRAALIGLKEGAATVRAIVRQPGLGREARAEAPVTVTPAAGEAPTGVAGANGRRPGLPSYVLVAAPGEPWRSRLSQASGEIEINSAHRDYIAARVRLRRLRRYVAKLYAKEVILLNFPSLPPAVVLDRLVELLTRMEERL